MFLGKSIPHRLIDHRNYIRTGVIVTKTVFESEEIAGGYVMEGTIEAEGVAINAGAVGFGFYMIEFVFMIILTIVMIKVLKSIDFKKIREEW